jgi:hypothetical protein
MFLSKISLVWDGMVKMNEKVVGVVHKITEQDSVVVML